MITILAFLVTLSIDWMYECMCTKFKLIKIHINLHNALFSPEESRWETERSMWGQQVSKRGGQVDRWGLLQVTHYYGQVDRWGLLQVTQHYGQVDRWGLLQVTQYQDQCFATGSGWIRIFSPIRIRIFQMGSKCLADLDPDSGKKVWSESGQKDPDPKHWPRQLNNPVELTDEIRLQQCVHCAWCGVRGPTAVGQPGWGGLPLLPLCAPATPTHGWGWGE